MSVVLFYGVSLIVGSVVSYCFFFFFFKQKTAYEMRISDWSSDVCSSDLPAIASRNSAQSATVRAIGPCTASGLKARDVTPRGTRPAVGRSPTTPQKDAGMRSEPPMSEDRKSTRLNSSH